MRSTTSFSGATKPGSIGKRTDWPDLVPVSPASPEELAQDPHEQPSIAVLMTCFNRRAGTLRCLEALYAQASGAPCRLTVFLVDDQSTDGTSAAVLSAFPEVRIITGTGNLFWNRGMHMAFAMAMQGQFDYYLWLNDDTILFPNALATLVATTRALEAQGLTAIVTGSTCDTEGKRSYGGIRLEGRLLRSLKAVEPAVQGAVPCDTMNGNCTLVPSAVAVVLRNLDPVFHHSFGDFDYGLRARQAGIPVYVAPGFLGACSDNPHTRTWRDKTAPFKVRWHHLTSAKGSPFPEWSVYCRRHLGPLWPLYAVSPYGKTLLASMRLR